MFLSSLLKLDCASQLAPSGAGGSWGPRPRQHYTVITGGCRSGKTVLAFAAVRESLACDGAVQVIDPGCNGYVRLSQELGGCYTRYTAPGERETEIHGNEALHVYDLQHIASNRHEQVLALLPISRHVDQQHSLLIIEEANYALRSIPNLVQLATDHLKQGGSLIVTSQQEATSADIAPLTTIELDVELNRSFIKLCRVL